MECLRSVFITYKDGAQTALDESRGKKWNSRIKLVTEAIGNLKQLARIKKIYKVEYLFSDMPVNLAQKPIISNKKYYLYKL